jgi:hypothetical protein
MWAGPEVRSAADRLDAARSHDMALPNFFIIGAAKAGTTSLHYYLDQHPQIQMSTVKEPNFFGGPENGVPYPGGRVGGLREYEQLFDATAEVRGEASPSYTNHPHRRGVPERIRALVPEAKFVYLVRDPVARTVSHYQHSVAVGRERRTLQDALGDLSESSLSWTGISRYATQLELYLSHFAAERVLVIDHAELLADRRATLRQILTFLSVDDAFSCAEFDQELYASRERRVYPPGYERIVGRVVKPALRWVPPRVRRSVRRSVERVLWSPVQTPELDERVRARLEELYAGEVERLRALTGKSFSTWSV